MKISLMAWVAGFCLVVGLPLAAMAGPTPGGADGDSDGVENAFDNCSVLGNASQCDTDHDGCGNACDGDFQNEGNGVAGLPDFGIFAAAFGSSLGQGNFNADADMNCDNVVGLPDFGLFSAEFGNSAGPSGVSNPGRDLANCP